MAELTVDKLARRIGMGTQELMSMIQAAGIEIQDAQQTLTPEQQQALQKHLQSGSKMTLGDKKKRQRTGVAISVRKTRPTISLSDRAEQSSTQDASHPAHPESAQLEPAQPELAQPELAQPEPAQPGPAQPGDKQSEPTLQDPSSVSQASPSQEGPQPSSSASGASHASEKTGAAKKTVKESSARNSQRSAGKGKKREQRRSKWDDDVDDANSYRRGTVKAQDTKLSHRFEKPVAAVKQKVELGETVKVSDLAHKMSVRSSELIRTMMNMGVMATINQVIDQETASLIVEEMGHEPVLRSTDTLSTLGDDTQYVGEAKSRAPVVTIMGHVDHGKTTLLDAIRQSKVTASEAGGITQHVGAYHVPSPHGGVGITVLDTPGHAAFTAMRARGAQVTDLVVLVVAADDGVMPQTQEAIAHAKAAEVPIVVAINKMDKESADIDRVKTELSHHELVPEDWGGDTMMVPVSALTREGLDTLLDGISLQAEMLELTAHDQGPAQGVVLESRLDKGRGPVATVLIQQGRLSRGDVLVAGSEFGRVRAMHDDEGQLLEDAGPSMPVELLGLSGLPAAGDEFSVVASEKRAREVAEHRRGQMRDKRLAKQQASRLEDMFSQMKSSEQKVLKVVLKGDVHGSVEAIVHALQDLSNDEIRVEVIASGVGGITESDANLAAASQALMVGFNVRADAAARRVVDNAGVSMHYYSVIYDLIDHVKASVLGMMAPRFEERILGVAEVRAVYRSSKFGDIAGCLVIEGKVRRQAGIRVLRDHVVVYEGALESLRRYKDDVQEVVSGMECGIGVKDYDVQEGDQIEAFLREEIKVVR